MNTNTAVFEDMPVPRAVRTMATPTIIGQLIILIYNMADTFFIGRTNDPNMVAGASLILPLFNITLSLAGLAGIGGGALVSRLLGQRREDEARRVYSFSVYLCAAVSAVFSVTVLLTMRPLMLLLGADDATIGYASGYAFCVIVCGGIPTVLSNTLSTLLRSIGQSRSAGVGVALGGILNIILDPLFMFVLLPDGMEIIGAGIATALSNLVSCIYFIIRISAMKQSAVLKLCSPACLPSKRSIAEIFSVGVPSSLVTFLFDLDYIVIDKLMSAHSDVALAAVGIVLKAERLPLNIGVGLCQGMLPIIAYNYSAHNYDRLRETKRYTRTVGLICAAVSVTLYEIFAGYIMRVFIDDAATMAIGTQFLRARCIATPFMFLSFFHVYMFNAMGEGKYSLALGIIRWAFLNIPMLFVLDALFGEMGIVWTQAVADIITVVISLIVYKRYENKSLRTRSWVDEKK